jgi:Uma2 family endonuclease
MENGDRMSQADFHQAVVSAPKGFRAELVGGIVFIPSPVGARHASVCNALSGLVWKYRAMTEGVEAGAHVNAILGPDSEPQPDLIVRVRPECGGRSKRVADGSLRGVPELVIEVAHGRWSMDLHAKRRDYAGAGVPEYLVYVIDETAFRWFSAAGGEIPIPTDGVIRSRQFPGFWIDVAALAATDDLRLTSRLEAGMATPSHAAFVRALAARRTKK